MLAGDRNGIYCFFKLIKIINFILKKVTFTKKTIANYQFLNYLIHSESEEGIKVTTHLHFVT